MNAKQPTISSGEPIATPTPQPSESPPAATPYREGTPIEPLFTKFPIKRVNIRGSLRLSAVLSRRLSGSLMGRLIGGSRFRATLSDTTPLCPVVSSHPQITWAAGPTNPRYAIWHQGTRRLFLNSQNGIGLVLSTQTNAFVAFLDYATGLDFTTNMFNLWPAMDTKNDRLVLSDQRGRIRLVNPSSLTQIGAFLDTISPGSPPSYGISVDTIHGLGISVTPAAGGAYAIFDTNGSAPALVHSASLGITPNQSNCFNVASGKWVICNAGGGYPYVFLDPLTYTVTPSALAIGAASRALYEPNLAILVVQVGSDIHFIDAVTDTVIATRTSMSFEEVAWDSCTSRLWIASGSAYHILNPATAYSVDSSVSTSIAGIAFDPWSNLMYGPRSDVARVDTY